MATQIKKFGTLHKLESFRFGFSLKSFFVNMTNMTFGNDRKSGSCTSWYFAVQLLHHMLMKSVLPNDPELNLSLMAVGAFRY